MDSSTRDNHTSRSHSLNAQSATLHAASDQYVDSGEHEHLIQQFHKFINDNAVDGYRTGGGTAKFVLRPALESWLQRDRRIDILLGPDHFKDREMFLDEYTCTLSTLLFMRKPKAIKAFIQAGCNDANPPSLRDDNPIFAEFISHHFTFFPWCPESRPNCLGLDSRYILPLYNGKQLGTESAATVRLSNTTVYRYDIYKDCQRGCCFKNRTKIVLKVYAPDAMNDVWTSEVSTFEKLGANAFKYVVEYLGSFTQSEYRIIMEEYADEGNLDTFYKRVSPPRTIGDLKCFWDSLFKLLHGLQCIHNPKETQGRFIHQDIKPSNILVFRAPSDAPYPFQFKLADFGKAHIAIRPYTDCEGEILHEPQPSNRLYTAPETYRRYSTQDGNPDKVDFRADIWALGAVFSEALVWTWQGKEGPLWYRIQREKALKQIGHMVDSGHDVCFHDGRKRLSVIKETHARVLDNRMYADRFFSSDISELILEAMLQDEAQYRSSAMDVYHRYENRLRSREEATPNGTTQTQDENTFDDRSTSGGDETKDTVGDNTGGHNGGNSRDPEASDRGGALGEQSYNSATQDSRTLVGILLTKYIHHSRLIRFGSAMPMIKENMPIKHALKLIREMTKLIIIDDLMTNRVHKKDVAETAEALCYLFKAYGPVRVFFASNQYEKVFTKSSQLRRKIERRSFSSDVGLDPCVSTVVGTIIDEINFNTLRVAHGFCLYVLTNGAWGTSGEQASEDETGQRLQHLIEHLIEKKWPRNKALVQFVQFGNDPAATDRLRSYDNKLPKGLLKRLGSNGPSQHWTASDMDIIDRKPHNAPVQQILIGSLRKENDRENP